MNCWIGKVFFASFFLIFSFGFAQTAAGTPSPEVIKGLTWLQGQVQTPGTLANESLSIATSIQNRTETLQTLKLFATPPTALADLLATDTENNTEYLARRAMTLSLAGRDVSALITQLQTRQNADGGYGGTAGQASNAVDTAWVLLAYKAGGVATGIPAALGYLSAAQAADGSYQSSSAEVDLNTSAMAIIAMSAHADKYNVSTTIQKTVTHLQAIQTAAGGWNNSNFQTALAYLAIHDFVPSEPSASAIKQFLIAGQTAEGSWESDPYVTAQVLRALMLADQAPANPSLSLIRAKIVDAQTGLPMAGVAANLTGNASLASTTGVDGSVAFADLLPGSYSLQFAMAGYGTLSTAVVTQAGRTLDLGLLQMSKVLGTTTGSVRGMVKDTTGMALAGVSVSAAGIAAVTDSTGQYLINNIPPGAITLQASLTGYANVSSNGVLAAGGVLVFSPTLSAGAVSGTTLQGQIVDAATSLPLGGVSVALTGGLSGVAITDAAGHYVISGILPGSGTITVSLAGYDVVSAALNLPANTTVNFSPRLYSQNTTPPNGNKASIGGIVIDAGTNLPLSNSTITVTVANVPQVVQTASDGSFTVGGISAATANVKASYAGYVDASIEVVLEPLVLTDLGQVRLRKQKVDSLLPDLMVKTLNRSGLVSDPQSLLASGVLTVEVANQGTSTAQAGVVVMAFHDVNLNDVYDDGVDVVMGQSSTQDVLLPEAFSSISIPVQGKLPFRDAPIHIWVDSARKLVELSESNNIKSTASLAEVKPTVGTFNPVLKWQWTGSTILPSHKQVMSIPIVAPLQDTNGDGKINQNDTPTVVFNTFSGPYYSRDGVLRAISGKDGKELWTVSNSAYRTHPGGSIAAADIDGDGFVEVVTYDQNNRVIAFDHNGVFKWRSAEGMSGYASIAIADLDGDGKSEILADTAVLGFDGTLRWRAAATSMPIAVDLDLDGKPEVLMEGRAYSANGQLLWQTPLFTGFSPTAIGNFNQDPYPEIAYITNGKVYLLDHLGKAIWGPVYIPGGGGGAPTVADMDGDGSPEIGVAGAYSYSVFKSDGTLLWSKTTRDYSSMVTGSSVFDFKGDGKANVVYSDEYFLRIYQGNDGTELFKVNNSTGTLFELPVIVDVDNDNHADIVVCTNNYAWGSNGAGIRAYSDANNSWANTRKIWNQHSYHITNINEDGSVPKVEQNSWQVHNSYRLNARPGISAFAAADMTASYLRVQDRGGMSPSTLTVRVGNGGSLPVDSGVSVTFYNGNPATGGTLLGAATTSTILGTGMFEDVSIAYAQSLSSINTLYAVVNEKFTIPESDKTNNSVSLALASWPVALSITVATDQPSYQANSSVAITSSIVNSGSFAGVTNVRYTIETADGLGQTAVLPDQSGIGISANGSQNNMATWNTSSIYAGPYRVKAELIDSNGTPFAAAFAPFDIATSSMSGVGSKVSVDKLSYLPFDLLRISGRVTNLMQNQSQSDLQAVVTIYRPDGTAFWTQTTPLQQLAIGGFVDLGYGSQLSAVVAGKYRVTLSVQSSLTGLEVAASQTYFDVLSSADTGSGLKGRIAALPKIVPQTDPVILDGTIDNLGNADIATLPVTVRIVEPVSQQVMSQWNYTANVLVGQPFQTALTWDTSSATVGTTYVAVLTAMVSGKEVTLAQDNFTVTEPPVKLDVIQNTVRENRVLVWLACDTEERGREEGHDGDKGRESDKDHAAHATASPAPGGKAGVQCTRPVVPKCIQKRSAFLQGLLTSYNVPYLITSNRDDFRKAFRSGRYNAYWISGAVKAEGEAEHKGEHKAEHEEEADQLLKEVREAVYRGDSLIIDGESGEPAEHSKVLADATGLEYRGKLPTKNNLVTTSGLMFSAAQVPTLGKADKLLVTTGTVQALFAQPVPGNGHDDHDGHDGHDEHHDDHDQAHPKVPQPAIIGNAYGRGQTLVFGFDLVGNLQAGSGAASWNGILLTGLTNLVPPLPDKYSGGAYVSLTTLIQELANRTTELAVTAHLPSGATLLNTAPTATLDANGLPVWNFSLPATTAKQLQLSMRLPQLPGTHVLPITVDSIRNGTSKRYGEYSYSWTVSGSDQLLNQVVGDLKLLALTDRGERKARDKAVSQLQRATTLIARKQYAEALDALLEAVEQLREIRSVDVSAYRLSLDRLLQETGWNWLRAAGL